MTRDCDILGQLDESEDACKVTARVVMGEGKPYLVSPNTVAVPQGVTDFKVSNDYVVVGSSVVAVTSGTNDSGQTVYSASTVSRSGTVSFVKKSPVVLEVEES